MTTVNNLAFDFGASSGRLILSRYCDGKITLEELHRFSNDPVKVNGVWYWDTFRLLFEIKEGLKKAAALAIPFHGIGIDTWGVDYALLDKEGNIIGMPITYRDSRTETAIEEVGKIVPLKEIYDKTGIEFIGFNTLFQLFSDKKMRPDIFEKADAVLLMPDLFGYLLTGVKYNEYTIASTGQLIEAENRIVWDELLSKLGINPKLFQKPVMPGTVIGKLSKEIMEETGMPETDVIAVASHDTASAVVGTPLEDANAAFLSCGTWSLLGLELDKPLINEETFAYNYTNEGGADNKLCFMKNINGLWVMQQLRKRWNELHEKISFPDMIAAARNAENKAFRIDLSDPVFMTPLDMIEAIKTHCEAKGQGKPETLGEFANAVYNGITEEYKTKVNDLEKLTGKTISQINMIGGGIQDELLCQLTASVTGKKVLAGPVEGSVLGNAVMQLKAIGAIKDLREGRMAIKNSFEQKIYLP
jgi:rhamnulokinase